MNLPRWDSFLIVKLTEDLHFDVSGLFNKLFHEERAVAERRQGFRVRPLVVLLELLKKQKTEKPTSLINAAIPEGTR